MPEEQEPKAGTRNDAKEKAGNRGPAQQGGVAEKRCGGHERKEKRRCEKSGKRGGKMSGKRKMPDGAEKEEWRKRKRGMEKREWREV